MQHRKAPGFPWGGFTTWRAAVGAIRAMLRAWDYRTLGANPVRSGPLVVAANHFSHLDPVVVSIAVGRPIRFLGVDELFGRSRFFDGLTFYLGVIPTPRGGVPLGALRTALDHLGRGGVVGVFPEGRRVSEWGESAPKQGAAWLAMRTGAPLLPVAIAGTEHVFGVGHRRVSRAPVRAAVGDPIDPGDFADRATLTQAWWEWIDPKLAELGHGVS